MSKPINEMDAAAQAILSTFRERFDGASDRVSRGCGLSDALFVERIWAEATVLLEDVPADLREAAKAIAYEFGYNDGEEEPYYGPGTCFLTGIDEHCCPCGRHP